MNKIFKVIWNPATGNYTVASETAKSRCKKSGRKKLLLSALVATSGLFSSCGGYASVSLDGGASAEATPLGDLWIAIGKGAVVSSDSDGISSVAIGAQANATGVGGIALGYQSQATGDRAVAQGFFSKATGDRAIAIGSGAEGQGDYTLAMGRNAKAVGDNSLAFGQNTQANGANAIVFGQNAKADGANTIALGQGATTSVDNNIAIGQDSFVGGDDSIAIGNQTSATGNNSVALGANSEALADNTVSVGNSTTQRKIVNMAAGTISSSSTDAINGSQLYAISKSVSDRLGGSSTVNSDGTVNAPSYRLKSGNFNNVGGALTGLDNNTLQWNTTLSAFSAAHGTETTSKITNVASGELSSSSTDAVNGSQLKATNDTVATNTTNIATNTANITTLTTTVDTLSDDALQWDATLSAFSAAHGTETTSKITNVASGELSSSSTDAVNGSQLKATNDTVATNTTNIATNTANITTLTTTVDTLSDDAMQWDATAGAYSAAHGTDTTGKITDVKAGTVSSTSTDAINGGQLYGASSAIAEALGGGSTVDANGYITAPTFTIDNTEYNNVSDALNATTNMITQITGDTSNTYIEDHGAGVNYIRTNDTGLGFKDASAAGIGSTAVGYNAVASADSSIAIGQNSSSTIEGSIALGSGSTSDRVITKGTRSASVTESGVVIGYDTTDGELLGALSVGTEGESYRQIINVADGTESHDAVTVRQLQNAIGAVATTPTKYFHANSTEEDSLAVGTDAIAVGAKTVVNGDAGIGMGTGSIVDQTAKNGIAIGTNATASYADSIAMGSNAMTTVGAQSGYTAYNLSSAQNSVGEFSVGSATGQRQITNVAAGSADTDAVNVAQLKVTDSKVAENTANISSLVNKYTNLDTRINTLETSMGDITVSGGSDYLAVNSTGDAAIATGDESVAVGAASTASAKNSVALGSGSVANEENTVSVGSSTQQRRITNVSAGVNATDAVNVAQLKASEAGSIRYETNTDGSVKYDVLNLGDGKGSTTRISNVSAAVNDNDAVNYAQLKQSVQEANYYTDQKMGEMNSKIQGVEDKMSGGIASAMAMASLPQAYAPGASMTSLAGSTYNGETAVALGVSMVSASGSWVYKLQGTSNSRGDYSAAIGAGIQW